MNEEKILKSHILLTFPVVAQVTFRFKCITFKYMKNFPVTNRKNIIVLRQELHG